MCNQSSAKAHESRTMPVSGAVSKEEAIGKFYPLCVQLLSGAMGNLSTERKEAIRPLPLENTNAYLWKRPPAFAKAATRVQMKRLIVRGQAIWAP